MAEQFTAADFAEFKTTKPNDKKKEQESVSFTEADFAEFAPKKTTPKKATPIPKREPLKFGVKFEAPDVIKATPFGTTVDALGILAGTVLPAMQREEAIATESVRELKKNPELLQRLSPIPLSLKEAKRRIGSPTEIANIMRGLSGDPTALFTPNPEALNELSQKKSVQKAAKGETVSELGDLLREAGFSEPVSALGGMAMSQLLPSNLMLEVGMGAVVKPGAQVARATKPTRFQRIFANLAGVEKEVLEDVATKGFRTVLKERFFNKRLPAQIANTFDQRIDDFFKYSDEQFDLATEQAGRKLFDKDSFLGNVKEFFQKSKKDFFKGKGARDFNDEILEGVQRFTSEGQLNTQADAIQMRRFLDKKIKAGKREGVDLDFAFELRKQLNDQLHTDDAIKQADEMWTVWKDEVSDIATKLQKDTGENVIKRFSRLPEKTQKKILTLDEMLPGDKIMGDVVNFSLAQEFIPRLRKGGLNRAGMVERLTNPALVKTLRGAEALSPATQRLSRITQTISPALLRPPAIGAEAALQQRPE